MFSAQRVAVLTIEFSDQQSQAEQCCSSATACDQSRAIIHTKNDDHDGAINRTAHCHEDRYHQHSNHLVVVVVPPVMRQWRHQQQSQSFVGRLLGSTLDCSPLWWMRILVAIAVLVPRSSDAFQFLSSRSSTGRHPMSNSPLSLPHGCCTCPAVNDGIVSSLSSIDRFNMVLRVRIRNGSCLGHPMMAYKFDNDNDNDDKNNNHVVDNTAWFESTMKRTNADCQSTSSIPTTIARAAASTADTTHRSSVSTRKLPTNVSPLSRTRSITSSRRLWIQSSLLACATTTLLPPSLTVAHARGLVQFPLLQLSNTYHFLRAGTSLLEQDDIWSTNPLFLTNREDALSPLGQEQVMLAMQQLKQAQQSPTIVRYSLAAVCSDTVDILQRELKLGRDLLLPEYTFLDPRAIGAWDMTRQSEWQPVIWALDADMAGPNGMGARPPPNDDGTPHETLQDQSIRLRQLLSILESQNSGDTVLLIFPDGTGPALLSVMMAGIPLNRVHELEFAPGELRMNITAANTRALLQQRELQPNVISEYQSILKQGRQRYKSWQTGKLMVVNLKDERLECERLEVEEAYEERDRQRQEQQRARIDDRQQQQQQQRAAQQQQQQQQQQDADDGTSSWLSMLGGNNNNNNKNMKGTMAVLSGTAVILSAVLSSARPPNAAMPSNETQSDMVDDLGNGSPSNLDESSSPSSNIQQRRINWDRKRMVAVPSPPTQAVEDPYEAAQRAMDEYLNQDDGAEGWLLSVEEILEEPEVDHAGDEGSTIPPPLDDVENVQGHPALDIDHGEQQ